MATKTEAEILEQFWRQSLDVVESWSLFGRKVRVQSFISRSKGNGRLRKYPKEIILVSFSGNGQWHLLTEERLPRLEKQICEALSHMDLWGEDELRFFWNEVQKEIRQHK